MIFKSLLKIALYSYTFLWAIHLIVNIFTKQLFVNLKKLLKIETIKNINLLATLTAILTSLIPILIMAEIAFKLFHKIIK